MVPERGVLRKEEEEICNCSHLWQSENSHPHGTLGQSILPWLLSIQQNPMDAKRYNKGQTSRTTTSVWQKERCNRKSVNIRLKALKPKKVRLAGRPAVVSLVCVILEWSTVLYRMFAAKLDTNSSED